MAEDDANSGFKVPKFNGTRSEYQMFKFRFLAYAEYKNFSEVVEATAAPDLPRTQAIGDALPDKEGNRTAKLRMKQNKLAYACLTMALHTNATLGILMGARTNDWPKGLAWKVMQGLERQFAPKDMISAVELERMLAQTKLRGKEDPNILLQQINALEVQYRVTIEDKKKAATIMAATTSEYQPVITSLVATHGENVPIEELMSQLFIHWRGLYGGQQKNVLMSKIQGNTIQSDGKELTLAGMSNVRCWYCKQAGHKANNCPEKKNNGAQSQQLNQSKKNGNNAGGNNKFTGKCILCGKTGHKAQDCWTKPENFDKAPEGFKKRNKPNATGMASVDTMLMCWDTEDGHGRVGTKHVSLSAQETLEFPNDMKLLSDPNVWIAETGSTADITPHKEGFINLKQVGDEFVAMGNKQSVQVVATGDLPVTICDKSGHNIGQGTMPNVDYVPEACVNLFSVNKRVMNGWLMNANSEGLTLSKGDLEIKFDLKIHTQKGTLFAGYLKRTQELSAVSVKKHTKMTIDQAHAKLGHMDERTTREAAKARGWEIIPGSMKKCASCAAGKARQKNVNKIPPEEPSPEGEVRAYLDLAHVKSHQGIRLIGAKNWRIIVIDPVVQLKFSHFYAAKSDMVEPTCELLNMWRQNKVEVTHLRMDDGGENISLAKRLKSSDWKLPIKIEFTAARTPQQNWPAEVGFYVILNRARAMMHHANIPVRLRYRLWREAVKTATLMDGLVVVKFKGKEKTRYEHIFGSVPGFAKKGILKTWGEAGTVTIKTDTHPKLLDRGVHCLFVGYSLDHSSECYRMFDPKTQGVRVVRDITWLNRMFYQKTEEENELEIHQDLVVEEDPDDSESIAPVVQSVEAGKGNDEVEVEDFMQTPSDVETETQQDEDMETEIQQDEDEESDEEERTNRYGRVLKAPERLTYTEMGGTILDPYTLRYMTELNEANEKEFAFVGAGIGDGIQNTEELKVLTYDEAMSRPDKAEWEKSVLEEYKRMQDNQVFQAVPKHQVPKEANIIDSTWAMKKKASGVYRARLAARGFKQKAGQSYDPHDIMSPVVGDIVFKMLMSMTLMAGWTAYVVDVKGAFLKPTFEDKHQVYMKVPKGFEKFFPPDVYLLLLKTLYGTKQAAKRFWKYVLMLMQAMGFTRNKAELCVYYKWTELYGLLVWTSFIDDMILFGTHRGVMKYKQMFLEQVDCDDVGPLNEYLGCKVEINHQRKMAKITQPVLLRSLEEQYSLEHYKAGEFPETPAAPNETLVPPREGEVISYEKQQKYRTGLGKLLYLTKWSRPEIGNAVREISRYMGGATVKHVKAVERIIKYCLGTKDTGLTMQPNSEWNGSQDFEFEITGVSDADYAKCKLTRRSVSGITVMLNGVPVCSKSKMQSCVTLSVAEAETVAGVDCVTVMMFVFRILEEMKLNVKMPMIHKMDCDGAIIMTHNWSTGRTRHVEVRYYYLRELNDQGIVHTEYVNTKDNISDIFTKNLSGPEFHKHARKLVSSEDISKPGKEISAFNNSILRKKNSTDQVFVQKKIRWRPELINLTIKMSASSDTDVEWDESSFDEDGQERKNEQHKRSVDNVLYSYWQGNKLEAFKNNRAARLKPEFTLKAKTKCTNKFHWTCWQFTFDILTFMDKGWQITPKQCDESLYLHNNLVENDYLWMTRRDMVRNQYQIAMEYGMDLSKNCTWKFIVEELPDVTWQPLSVYCCDWEILRRRKRRLMNMRNEIVRGEREEDVALFNGVNEEHLISDYADPNPWIRQPNDEGIIELSSEDMDE